MRAGAVTGPRHTNDFLYVVASLGQPAAAVPQLDPTLEPTHDVTKAPSSDFNQPAVVSLVAHFDGWILAMTLTLAWNGDVSGLEGIHNEWRGCWVWSDCNEPVQTNKIELLHQPSPGCCRRYTAVPEGSYFQKWRAGLAGTEPTYIAPLCLPADKMWTCQQQQKDTNHFSGGFFFFFGQRFVNIFLNNWMWTEDAVFRYCLPTLELKERSQGVRLSTKTKNVTPMVFKPFACPTTLS